MPPVARVRVETEAAMRALLASNAPAIVEGMFDGTRMAEIDTVDKLVRRFGSLSLRMSKNYANGLIEEVHEFLAHRRPPKPKSQSRTVTIAEYVEMVKDPACDWLLTECPVPSELVPLVGPPAVWSTVGVDKLFQGYYPPPDAAGTLWFMANRGNASDLHTDWDGHHVLHHQVFGSKRWVMFPPSAGPKLHAVTIFGTIRLRGMPAAEREAFVRYAGGIECEVHPGETIYVPPFYYHDVEYLEHALGVAFRLLGPRTEVHELKKDLHRGYYLQNLWVRICADPDGAASRSIVDELRAALDRDYPNAIQKYRAIEQLARTLCERHALVENRWKITATDCLDMVLAQKYVPPRPEWGRLKKALWAAKNLKAWRLP